MTYAVHNYHSPAVEIDEAGTYTHDGKARLSASAPLATFATMEDAEAWRVQDYRRLRAAGREG